MKHWTVRITDGNDITHVWSVSGRSIYQVLCYILETMHEDSYGMPYGIKVDGITKVEVIEEIMNNKVWGYSKHE